LRLVRPITRQDYLPFLIDMHYAGVVPSITWAWGLFKNGYIEGVVTYGTPSSSPLRKGICGPDMASHVIELNRLCLKSNERNDASFLVAKSLKILPKSKIVVSFADTSQGHEGYVYQACNFIYTGLSAKRTDWKVKGKTGHGQTIADEFRGMANRSQLMKDKYGDDFYLEDRPRKHRYVYFVGSKGFKAKCNGLLRYPVEPYPKLLAHRS